MSAGEIHGYTSFAPNLNFRSWCYTLVQRDCRRCEIPLTMAPSPTQALPSAQVMTQPQAQALVQPVSQTLPAQHQAGIASTPPAHATTQSQTAPSFVQVVTQLVAQTSTPKTQVQVISHPSIHPTAQTANTQPPAQPTTPVPAHPVLQTSQPTTQTSNPEDCTWKYGMFFSTALNLLSWA